MHPFKQLQTLLQSKSLQQGKLIAADNTQLTISTASGVQIIQRQPNDITNYRAGDTVVIANGAVVGRRKSATDSEIYIV